MAPSGFGKRFPARDAALTRSLAANVKSLRKAKKWTQDDLAARADVEQAAVSLVENGRANPTLLMLENLAAALGVDFLELFQGRRPRRGGKSDKS